MLCLSPPVGMDGGLVAPLLSSLLVLYVIQLFIHKGCECVRVTVLFQGNFKGLPFEDDIKNKAMRF